MNPRVAAVPGGYQTDQLTGGKELDPCTATHTRKPEGDRQPHTEEKGEENKGEDTPSSLLRP